MASLTPEQLRERALKANASRKVCKSKTGLTKGWTKRTYAPVRDEAHREAKRIFKLMEKEGLLPEDNMAKAALLEAFTMMGEENSTRDKLSIIRTVLEWTKSKPASTQNLNIKTAEDFLDELANEDSDDSGREA